jgi:hypothetical protein
VLNSYYGELLRGKWFGIGGRGGHNGQGSSRTVVAGRTLGGRGLGRGWLARASAVPPADWLAGQRQAAEQQHLLTPHMKHFRRVVRRGQIHVHDSGDGTHDNDWNSSSEVAAERSPQPPLSPSASKGGACCVCPGHAGCDSSKLRRMLEKLEHTEQANTMFSSDAASSAASSSMQGEAGAGGFTCPSCQSFVCPSCRDNLWPTGHHPPTVGVAEWMHRQHAPESAYCGRASPEDTIPDDAITSDAGSKASDQAVLKPAWGMHPLVDSRGQPVLDGRGEQMLGFVHALVPGDSPSSSTQTQHVQSAAEAAYNRQFWGDDPFVNNARAHAGSPRQQPLGASTGSGSGSQHARMAIAHLGAEAVLPPSMLLTTSNIKNTAAPPPSSVVAQVADGEMGSGGGGSSSLPSTYPPHVSVRFGTTKTRREPALRQLKKALANSGAEKAAALPVSLSQPRGRGGGGGRVGSPSVVSDASEAGGSHQSTMDRGTAQHHLFGSMHKRATTIQYESRSGRAQGGFRVGYVAWHDGHPCTK